MKFFLAVALLATAASATFIPVAPVVAGFDQAEIQQIVDAINSPSTNPATAAALEQMLLDALGLSPISVGPAIVDHEPISVGPEIIDFPIAQEIEPSPVIVAPSPAEARAPLVQIILNINKAGSGPVVGSPVVVGPAVIEPTPVQVVESEPVIIGTPIIAPTPIQVVEQAPVPAEPVLIGAPVIPSPAVNLPETLN